MSIASTPYNTSPICSLNEEWEYLGDYPPFSPLQDADEEYPSQQAQVVPDFWVPETPLAVQETLSVSQTWMLEIPPSAQREHHMDDCKYPPHVLEQMDNSQLSPEPGVYFDYTPLLRFSLGQLEGEIQKFYEMVNKQDNKLKAQEEVIKKLQMRVDK